MITLDLRDTRIALAFPGGNGVLLIPDVKKLRLLAGKFQLVLVAHIKISAGDCATGAGGRLGELRFKIHFHGALPVLTFAAVPLAIHKVAAIAIHFANRGLQVMHIAFHFAVDRVFSAVFSPAVLPALALMTELPGGDNVLPLNASGAILVFTHLIAAGLQVYDAFFTLPADLAPAVKAAGRVGIDFDARRFGLRKIVNAVGQGMA